VSRIVTVGALLAGAGAVHSVVNARQLRRPAAPDGPLPSVAVLIPARDEAANIAAGVASVDQGIEVVVLDDDSSDDTAAVAARAGARVVPGAPLPPGWLGKPWACAQLAAAADADVLVFLDADVRLAPGAVPAAAALLLAADLDIACPFPRQLAVTPAERLVQPLLQWSWLTTLPLRLAEGSSRPSLTAACGQFLVVRRAALERAGGFAAVRDAVFDDLALVRAVKASGGRGGVVDGTALATCRMYASWPELRDGYGKSLWAAFGSPPGAVAVLAGLALAYVVPPIAALRGSRTGFAGYLAAVASRVVAARATGGRAWPDAAAHPASVVTFGYLTLRSLRERRRGSLRWKGRPI
jgi:cellulose synthase/poly-beta-1,6-N-acetylglucosamine synthase-like glycosyltransferase